MNTKEKTRHAITVMEAYLAGKTIQCFKLNPGRWIDIEGYPDWDWYNGDYRIKPEPKEIWVNEHEDGRLFAFFSPGYARDDSICTLESNYKRVAVKYREVTDE